MDKLKNIMDKLDYSVKQEELIKEELFFKKLEESSNLDNTEEEIYFEEKELNWD